MSFQNARRFYFVGIGGIGMSGIAKILHLKGFDVSGSDLKPTHFEGIKTYVGHHSDHIKDIDVVVTSTDVPDTNIEIVTAKALGIPVVKRADMLAEIMKLFENTVSISGTHGKTTTTALIGAVLHHAHLNPTVINGGIINAFESNIHMGDSQWCVVEADESDGSFLKLLGTYSIVTNVDMDHVNYYGDSFENLKNAFIEFIMNTSIFGTSILCIDDPIIRSWLPLDRKIMTYGLSDDAMVQAFNIRKMEDKTIFDVKIQTSFTKILKDVELSILGTHNVLNALSAITLAQILKLDEEAIYNGFRNFHGVQRRFTIRGVINGVTIVDDYAHHPKEVTSVLDIAHQKNAKKVIAVFQPHRYSRVKILIDDFAKSLSAFDHVIMAPLYSAGESVVEGVDSLTISKKMTCPYTLINHEDEIRGLINSLTTPGDMVIFIGAGNVTEWSKKIVALG